MESTTGSPGIIWHPANWWNPEDSTGYEEGPADSSIGAVVVSGDQDRMVVALEKPSARPGERWNEVMVRISGDDDARLRARLYAIGGSDAVEDVVINVANEKIMVLADLRRYSLPSARLTLELPTACAEVFLTADEYASPDESTSVPIHLDVRPGLDISKGGPVTFGVPFPPGAVWEIDSLSLVDANGNKVPQQMETTGRWGPDGAAKWVRFDAIVASAESHSVEFESPGATDESSQMESPQDLPRVEIVRESETLYY